MTQNVYSYILKGFSTVIDPRWYIKGRELASLDILTRDIIHQYQCNNPISLNKLELRQLILNSEGGKKPIIVLCFD